MHLFDYLLFFDSEINNSSIGVDMYLTKTNTQLSEGCALLEYIQRLL